MPKKYVRKILVTLKWLTGMLLLPLLVLLVGCEQPQQENMAPQQHTATSPDQNADTLILAIGGEEEQGYDPTLGWG
ncbi:MAG: hypothetical protein D3910_14745, partial [Candidatus Electrothrix sp. ATG2]|nr:hypothetical protein [Candidatus Electrothrix sp. ATG2]